MSRRIDLLRLDYLFSVIVPCLMAIFINDLNIMNHLDILAGFSFYAITGNTLNDMIDAKNPDEKETIERIKGFQWKEIAAISIVSFIFGTTLFIRTITEKPINALIIVIIIAMVVLYCVKKDVPIVNQILLGISHVFLPYLIIKIDANSVPIISGAEWFLMLNFFCFAFTGQIVHEIIDGDSISRLSLKTQRLTVIISSIITIFVGIIAVLVIGLPKSVYFIPFCLIPIGSIYTFRKPIKSISKGVKDVGLILGNIILVYLLVLILVQ